MKSDARLSLVACLKILEWARQNRNLTYADVAKRSKLRKTAVFNALTGKTDSWVNAEKIANSLGMYFTLRDMTGHKL